MQRLGVCTISFFSYRVAAAIQDALGLAPGDPERDAMLDWSFAKKQRKLEECSKSKIDLDSDALVRSLRASARAHAHTHSGIYGSDAVADCLLCGAACR
jgi:hypothetical protein